MTGTKPEGEGGKEEDGERGKGGKGGKGGRGGDGLRPWRKRALQIITTDIWRKDSVEEIIPLPQVAGHGSHDAKQAILTGKNGCILKPIQAPPRGVREKNFYEEVFSSQDPQKVEFQTFLPKYYGSCKKKNKDGDLAEFLMIENLTQGLTKPCIMDVKIGAKTYGPDANQEKIAKQDASYSGTKKPFGFSILGMSIYTGSTRDTFTILNKDYGKGLNESNIEDFMVNYLDSMSNETAAKTLGRILVEKLNPILDLFSKQTVYHMYGSSLLFVYDAHVLEKYTEGTVQLDKLSTAVRVTMIDFAHVWDGAGHLDENYLKGIQNLVQVFDKFST
ncbi:inositol polyphosphate multikinase alpha isoform X2 [Eurytemora carolleeae]|uniref:inositol polyphosphate multikinase alpha isoform X2 n=1 Tax=Eurytemora carolleeae TaxID=1294199 RepID=UPI000C7954DB|nr:inositol polyphosphate multikinase alpha isoform X2 [Eurytemora carolleeae]|eukprot:XP_023349208.1 inositol polyphosphate multikinase alpha-like isoform X2 [Eurytemora affinis]